MDWKLIFSTFSIDFLCPHTLSFVLVQQRNHLYILQASLHLSPRVKWTTTKPINGRRLPSPLLLYHLLMPDQKIGTVGQAAAAAEASSSSSSIQHHRSLDGFPKFAIKNGAKRAASPKSCCKNAAFLFYIRLLAPLWVTNCFVRRCALHSSLGLPGHMEWTKQTEDSADNGPANFQGNVAGERTALTWQCDAFVRSLVIEKSMNSDCGSMMDAVYLVALLLPEFCVPIYLLILLLARSAPSSSVSSSSSRSAALGNWIQWHPHNPPWSFSTSRLNWTTALYSIQTTIQYK